MRLTFMLILAGALALALAPAASADDGAIGGQGYVFAAPGAITGGGDSAGTLHVGAGGEALLVKGFGLGAEAGYVAPFRAFGDGFGLASVNAAYHFGARDSEKKTVPFITAGYSRSFGQGSGANLVNFGGGVTRWFGESGKTGLRLEFRDHVTTSGGTAHVLGFRIGLSFR